LTLAIDLLVNCVQIIIVLLVNCVQIISVGGHILTWAFGDTI